MSTLLDRVAIVCTGEVTQDAAGQQLLDDIHLVIEEHLSLISAALHVQFGEKYDLTFSVEDQ